MSLFRRNAVPVVTCLILWAGSTPARTTVPATEEQTDRLITVLQSDASRQDKADACRLLAVSGTAKAIPALAALLAHEELAAKDRRRR